MDYFQKPDAPPEAKAGAQYVESPISRHIEFKSGRPQSPGVAEKVGPDDLGVRFVYYKPGAEEGESGELVRLPAFTLYVIGIYSRFAGTNFNVSKPKESDRYTSTLYRAPSDILFFRREFTKDIRQNPAYINEWAVGNYRDVRDFADRQAYREKVGYKKVIVAFCKELQEVVEIWASRKIDFGLAGAIAAATNTTPDTRRIAGLADLTTQIWGFRFTGDFTPVNDVKGRDIAKWDGKSEWAFAPDFECGVIRQGHEMFVALSGMAQDVSAYVDSQIAWAEKIHTEVYGSAAPTIVTKRMDTIPANNTAPEFFPSEEPAVLEIEELPF